MESMLPRVYIDHNDKRAVEKISEKLLDMIDDDTVYVCIGTPKVIGDSVAPRIGTTIKYRDLKHKVFGTELNPIHGHNICSSVAKLNNKYNSIVAIDSCIGLSNDIGKILIKKGCIKPGNGVGKDYPTIGTVSILAIVTDCKHNLHNVQDALVNNMADVISKAIVLAEIKKNKKLS